jgi:hypothetical protein
MFRKNWVPSATIIALTATIVPARSQDAPRSGTYQIQSGDYTELGGFAGAFEAGLPYPPQTYASLNIDPAGKARLSFLSQNQQSTFYIALTNGIVSSNAIRFRYWTTRPFSFGANLDAYVDYTLTNAAGHLWISGDVTSSVVCCDVTYWYSHSNIIATFIPSLALNFTNGVTVCWPSATNQSYQLQHLSDFTHDIWTNLGTTVSGNGATNCIILNPPPPGQTQGFYRIVTSP